MGDLLAQRKFISLKIAPSTEDESENKTTITRNLPSGSNIYETLTTRIKVNKDGTTKKTVITGQMANITTGKRDMTQTKMRPK